MSTIKDTLTTRSDSVNFFPSPSAGDAAAVLPPWMSTYLDNKGITDPVARAAEIRCRMEKSRKACVAFELQRQKLLVLEAIRQWLIEASYPCSFATHGWEDFDLETGLYRGMFTGCDERVGCAKQEWSVAIPA